MAIFEAYLERENSKYAAGNSMTIADFVFINEIARLEAVKLDLSAYPRIKKYYTLFKKEQPELWDIAKEGHDILILVNQMYTIQNSKL